MELNKFYCNKCDKVFEDKCEILKHMLLNHKEKELNIEKESEIVINMIRSITENIVENVEMSDNDKDGNKEESVSTFDLKRALSVSPTIKTQSSKREKKEQSTSKKVVDNKNLEDEMINLEEGAKLLEEGLTLLKEENTKLKTEVQKRDEDIFLLKEENNGLKKENRESKDKMKKVEDDAMEVVLKVSESLRGDLEKKKEEVVGAWKEYNKMKKEHEDKYTILMKENVKISEDMARMQEERDVAQVKVESLEAIEKAKKYETNLQKFTDNFPAGCNTISQDDAMDTGEPIDECIKLAKCIGNCKNLELGQVMRLKELKESGSNRTSPQSKTEAKQQNKTTFKCKHCDFNSENKDELNTHIISNHECHCTKCGGTSRSITNQDKHFQNFPGREDQTTKRPCRYFNQPGGCKKGSHCDFNHNGRSAAKVPKLCKDRQTCTWKPCCKFVHPEDGDQMPSRNISMNQQTPEKMTKKTNNQRLSPVTTRNQQNFHQTDFSQPPPNSIKEPAWKVEDPKMWLIPLKLQSLKEFPNLSGREGKRN